MVFAATPFAMVMAWPALPLKRCLVSMMANASKNKGKSAKTKANVKAINVWMVFAVAPLIRSAATSQVALTTRRPITVAAFPAMKANVSPPPPPVAFTNVIPSPTKPAGIVAMGHPGNVPPALFAMPRANVSSKLAMAIAVARLTTMAVPVIAANLATAPMVSVVILPAIMYVKAVIRLAKWASVLG